MPLEKQVMILYVAINGYLDDVPMDEVTAFEANFHRSMEANHPEIGGSIAKEKGISPETEEKLKAAIIEFKKTMSY
jgi:F-type H+-transporting ATPase subunit alpha